MNGWQFTRRTFLVKRSRASKEPVIILYFLNQYTSRSQYLPARSPLILCALGRTVSRQVWSWRSHTWSFNWIATLAINTQQWIVIIETSLGGKYNDRKWSTFRFRVSIKTGSSEQSKTFSRELDRDLSKKKQANCLKGTTTRVTKFLVTRAFSPFPPVFPQF